MASRPSRSPAGNTTSGAGFAPPAKVAHDPHGHETFLRQRMVMLNRYTLAGLGVLLVAAVLVLLHGNDENRILERLEQIRALAEMPSPEAGLEPLAKARQIAQFFQEQTVFDLTNAGYGTIEIAGRNELVGRIVRGRARLASLELKLQDARVNIEDDTAEAWLQGSGLGRFTGQQKPFLEIHTVAIRLQKVAGDWLVTGARHLRDERQSSRGLPE